MTGQDRIMDPACSPSRPGVRRVNSLPVLIVIGLFAIVGVVFVYILSGRASSATEQAEQKPGKSARQRAEEIVGDHEAGEIPTSTQTGGRASDKGDAANTQGNEAEGTHATQTVTRDETGSSQGLPSPPEAFGHPSTLATGGQGADVGVSKGPVTDAGADRQSGQQDEALVAMRREMFMSAIAAKSTVGIGARDLQSRPELGTALDEATPQSGNTGYVDRLRQLQEAGLVPGADESHRKREDGYERFEGRAGQDRWTLGETLRPPSSPYELRAGAVLPATLTTGINSDLPGQITALVAQDVRDTATGRHILIPQAARLVGTYGADVKYGQERVLVAWQRIVFPDGKALDIGAMPGSDGAGYAGFKDLVDSHFWRLLGGALLLSGITGGISLSQDSLSDEEGQTTVGGAMSQALGQQLGQLSEELIRKEMNVAPTIEIRPGYRFNVQVTKDLTFNAPYQAFDYERSITTGARTFR